MARTRFLKNIIGILSITMVAFIYVHQEVEIVKTGFLINKHHHRLTLLLDQYRSLVYNLSQLESPKRMEDVLYVNEIALCVPKIEKIHRLNRTQLAYSKERQERETKESFLAGIFDRFSTKAEAKDRL